jgi:hypothetical protein
MLKELLKRYESRNKAIPECIIYWRGGISESQIEAFKDSEIRGIKDNYLPCIGLTYIQHVDRNLQRSRMLGQDYDYQLCQMSPYAHVP